MMQLTDLLRRLTTLGCDILKALECPLEYLVHQLRVGFAAGDCHDLADQEVESALLAAPVLVGAAGMCVQTELQPTTARHLE